MTLFDDRLVGRAGAPLAVRMRPRSLDEVVGQTSAIGPGSPIRALIDGQAAAVSVILWGPPGTGKTTLAQLTSAATGRSFVELSAVTAGVREVREVIDQARDALSMRDVRTLLFIDEVHRFNKSQQDALLPAVENGWVTLVAATTENPSFSVVAPLLSRSIVVRLQRLDEDDLRQLLTRAVADPRGLQGEVEVEDEALAHIIRMSDGDGRRALTGLEAAAINARSSGSAMITLAGVEAALQLAAANYDRAGDQHYDVISAFIKSIRGSDPDASVFYLARMLEAGEDARFIARRLMILASEDIGMADPSALQTAVSAAQAVALVGMPEARIILAQATIHAALAPKSNAVVIAIGEAGADVRAGKAGQVPTHLRDSHYPGAASLGHGAGYIYPHDLPSGVAAQAYLPEALAGRRYYRPTSRGAEARWGAIAAETERLRRPPEGVGQGSA